MVLRVAWIDWLNRLAYTGFDLGLTALTAVTAFLLATRIWHGEAGGWTRCRPS
jgi:hypothetical protein